MSSYPIVNLLPSGATVSTLLLLLITSYLYLAYYFKKKYSYWEKRGVPCLKPIPFFGNTKDQFFQQVPISHGLQNIYNKLDGHKFGGFYQLTRPVLMPRDPEMVKLILVKSFSHFHDRNLYINEELDPLTANIFSLPGQRWKDVRTKLTPTFSAKNLKLMYNMLNECIDVLDEYLTKETSCHVEAGSTQNLPIIMSKLTTDIFGACACGIRCDSFNSDDCEFVRIIHKFAAEHLPFLRNILKIIYPKLIALCKLKVIDKEVEEFFMSTFKDAIKTRSNSEEKRNDLLQLLIDIQVDEKNKMILSGSSKHNGTSQPTGSKLRDELSEGAMKDQSAEILFTDNVVIGNVFFFFISSYETTAATLSYCLYELALNPDIYEKLREEVESTKKLHGENLDFSALKQLVYMDSIISETLRKYPPAPFLMRTCTQTFQLPESSIVIDKGTGVIVPIYALHNDPKYFPEPEKFLPERFSEENRHSVKPGTYLPFGDGPRMCIGMRFALCVIKATLSRLVSKYTVHLCKETAVPLKFSRTSGLSLAPEGGIWINFKRRPDAA